MPRFSFIWEERPWPGNQEPRKPAGKKELRNLSWVYPFIRMGALAREGLWTKEAGGSDRSGAEARARWPSSGTGASGSPTLTC